MLHDFEQPPYLNRKFGQKATLLYKVLSNGSKKTAAIFPLSLAKHLGTPSSSICTPARNRRISAAADPAGRRLTLSTGPRHPLRSTRPRGRAGERRAPSGSRGHGRASTLAQTPLVVLRPEGKRRPSGRRSDRSRSGSASRRPAAVPLPAGRFPFGPAGRSGWGGGRGARSNRPGRSRRAQGFALPRWKPERRLAPARPEEERIAITKGDSTSAFWAPYRSPVGKRRRRLTPRPRTSVPGLRDRRPHPSARPDSGRRSPAGLRGAARARPCGSPAARRPRALWAARAAGALIYDAPPLGEPPGHSRVRSVTSRCSFSLGFKNLAFISQISTAKLELSFPNPPCWRTVQNTLLTCHSPIPYIDRLPPRPTVLQAVIWATGLAEQNEDSNVCKGSGRAAEGSKLTALSFLKTRNAELVPSPLPRTAWSDSASRHPSHSPLHF